MIEFSEAKRLALSCWGEVDYCMEYADAFIFSKKDDLSFGGNGPVVVLKANGRCINMVSYIEDMSDGSRPIREGYLKDLE